MTTTYMDTTLEQIKKEKMCVWCVNWLKCYLEAEDWEEFLARQMESHRCFELDTKLFAYISEMSL